MTGPIFLDAARNWTGPAQSVPIAAYQELLERVEDAADIAWLRKARRKPLQYRSVDEYLAARKAK